MTTDQQIAEFERLLEDQSIELNPELELYLCDVPFWGRSLKHPLVFQHPLYSPGLANRALEQKKAALIAARKCGDWHSYIFLHERPYRNEAYDKLLPADMGSGERAQLLASVWTDCENIHQLLDWWDATFERTDGKQMMTDEDRDAFEELPERIELWRGGCNDGGWSWTLEKKVARFFADRGINESTGTLLHAWIAKDDVYAYLTSRQESEILVMDLDALELVNDE